MNLIKVRALFREQMELLGFREHRDAFNIENIPSTLIDGSFHLESGPVETSGSNQSHHVFDYNIKLRIFKKGFRDIAGLNDEIDGIAESVYDVILAPSLRLVQNEIKDIQPQRYQAIELSTTNDNIVILEMDFLVQLIICFE